MDPALEAVLETLVTPEAPVDLRAAVLRRIEERSSRERAWWAFNWRLAPLAAAAVILIVTAFWWRGRAVESPVTQTTRADAVQPELKLRPATVAEPELKLRTTTVAEPRDLAKPRNPGTQELQTRDVTPPLPALDTPAPIAVNALTNAVLQVDRLELPPLEIPTVDIDRPWPSAPVIEKER